MKRHICVFLMILLLSSVAFSEEMPNEAYDAIVKDAVDTLKAYWKEMYLADNFSESGYWEIKNTRLIVIRDNPNAGEYSSEKMDEMTRTYFDDYRYLIEFMLYTDYYGTEPYYPHIGITESVAVHNDGTLEVMVMNPIEKYRTRSYNNDYSGIIESIIDLGDAYNVACRLLDEKA